MQVVFPFLALEFFERVFGDNSLLASKEYNDSLNYWDVENSLWEEVSSNQATKTKRFKLKVDDVPFISEAEMLINYTVLKMENRFKINSTAQTVGVPYGDYFFVCEEWEAVDLEEEGKCVLRHIGWVDFVKSTMFKNTILTKSEEGIRNANNHVLDFLSKNGILAEKLKKSKGNETVTHDLQIQGAKNKSFLEGKSSYIYSLSRDVLVNKPWEVTKFCLLVFLIYLLLLINSKLNLLLAK